MGGGGISFQSLQSFDFLRIPSFGSDIDTHATKTFLGPVVNKEITTHNKIDF